MKPRTKPAPVVDAHRMATVTVQARHLLSLSAQALRNGQACVKDCNNDSPQAFLKTTRGEADQWWTTARVLAEAYEASLKPKA